MLSLVIKKMANNRWMFMCLLIGSLLVASMVSAIPMYTDAILQRMLVKDLEAFQVESGLYAGSVSVSTNLTYYTDEMSRSSVFRQFNNLIRNDYISHFGVPLRDEYIRVSTKLLQCSPVEQRQDNPRRVFGQLQAMTGFWDHVDIRGRMPSMTPVDGVIEVVATEEAMKGLYLLTDVEYQLADPVEGRDPVIFKVVGIFTYRDLADPYWDTDLSVFNRAVVMDYDQFISGFVTRNSGQLGEAYWHFAFDYAKMNMDQTPNVVKTFGDLKSWGSRFGLVMKASMPMEQTLIDYQVRQTQLMTSLWILLAPILLMLSFYIFMVSQLIAQHEENVLTLMKSRGASNMQMFRSFLYESVILSVVALAAGPFIGYGLCSVLGSANGFMEFIQRTSMKINMNFQTFMYAGISLLIFIISMLIPVIVYSRSSIVEYKVKKARRKNPLWKKIYLDVIVLGVSFYGLYSYQQSKEIVEQTGLSDVQVDPLLFLISTLFILGCGMLFLRLYPYFIRLIFWLGRRFWSPVFYASFIQVGRSTGQEQFLMIFIILAISTGMFSANAARTLNKNMEDKIAYTQAADVRIEPFWETRYVVNAQGVSTGQLTYVEPFYNEYEKIPGVEEITKVLTKTHGNATNQDGLRVIFGGRYLYDNTIMAINSDEFGRVTGLRGDLTRVHWYHYLNLLAENQMACLVSRSIQEFFNIKVGDEINIRWGNDTSFTLIVFGVVDYWPGYDPYIRTAQTSGQSFTGLPPSRNLIVANLTYIQNLTPLTPYEIWIRKAPGVTDTEIDQYIKQNLKVNAIDYRQQQIIKMKNDPMLQGTNGALTLGFVVAMIVCMIGFLIFWILSIKRRILQFGILRAMGLTTRKVIGMILCEQVLISGVAIGVGILIGSLVSEVFVPLLQMVYNVIDQILPFKVITDQSDYMKIYVVVVSMLVIGFTVLARIIT
ncbi:MAG: ABC transporter permease, partial [Oscillospiraceae bacterium]|nr:ABC transporter permease [Oscillospiraceae bacterium]